MKKVVIRMATLVSALMIAHYGVLLFGLNSFLHSIPPVQSSELAISVKDYSSGVIVDVVNPEYKSSIVECVASLSYKGVSPPRRHISSQEGAYSVILSSTGHTHYYATILLLSSEETAYFVNNWGFLKASSADCLYTIAQRVCHSSY